MNDNIIDFKNPKKKDVKVDEAAGNPEPQEEINRAEECLKAAAGRFEDVIIIGIAANNTTCLLTVGPEEAIYEFTHAIYQLNKNIDGE